ncbi:MAG: hypothetical protein KF880_11305, partial [Ferruginibacter sp.]|nr:hypothetical protein [Ferruginibacter sp.]
MLFGDDYVRFNKYLQKGLIVMIEGVFELKRFSKDVYEFKLIRIQLLSDAMATLPKQINLFVHPSDVSEDFISFLTQNVQKFNGNTKLSIELNDQLLQCRAKLETQHSQHFTMNEELAQYLQNNPKIQVMVDLN